MDFIEAMKSKKKVRPIFKSNSSFHSPNHWIDEIEKIASYGEVKELYFSRWEEEKPVIKITEEDVEKAIKKTCYRDCDFERCIQANKLKKELGF